MEIETERLIGRPPGVADAGALYLIHGDARAMKTLSAEGLPFTEAESLERLKRILEHFDAHGFGAWFFHLKTSGAFVGHCGLKHSTVEGEPEVELLYGLRPDHWRQGYGSEAATACLARGFGPLGLEEIVCFTLPHNRASRGVMERCGFSYEKPITHAGLPHVLYRLRRAEWLAQPSSETNFKA